MKQILTPYFWFFLKGDLAPVSQYLFAALTILLVGALIYLKTTRSTWKKTLLRVVYEKLTGFLWTNIFISFYLWFVTIQIIPVLSARIWFLCWAALMIIWLRFIYQEYLLIPERKKALQKQKELKKYIP